MRDERADVLSLKVGINVVNADSLKERTFAPALHGFIDTIREGKPNTPFLIASPIFCPSAEERPGPTIPNASGKFVTLPGHDEIRAGSLTLQQMRTIIRDVVEGAPQERATQICTISTVSNCSAPPTPADLPDDLHPNGPGYVRMGQRFNARAFGERRTARGFRVGGFMATRKATAETQGESRAQRRFQGRGEARLDRHETRLLARPRRRTGAAEIRADKANSPNAYRARARHRRSSCPASKRTRAYGTPCIKVDGKVMARLRSET